MTTLVIHPTDPTTDFLSIIYEGRGWNVMREHVSKGALNDAIRAHDRIIFLGHGTEDGLIGHNRFVIDSKLVYLLREKTCMYIWCHANKFVKKYKLRGYGTGMIISEMEEAKYYMVETTEEELKRSNEAFALTIKVLVDDIDMLQHINHFYAGNTPVFDFNKRNL